jgi:glycerol-3-phosphate acyltransferase PlsX
MAQTIKVAIDGMGGDNAPGMIVGGIDLACKRLDDVAFLLFGDEARLGPLLDAHGAAKSITEVRHTDKAISAEQKPTAALRGGKNSSMRLAIDAVKSGEASALVSAGNTGALMAMATVVLRTLPGIDRPAIAACLPTQRSQTVMLDLGANIDCSADNLVQFAVMGEVYARAELGLAQPSIGILNVGVEGLKGNDAVKEASAILQSSDLPISFYGFIEGDDIGKGTVDVVVTDGFTGNVALKTAEGAVNMFVHHLRGALTSSLRTKIGALLSRPALNIVKDKFDPRRYNGAMFVGLNGICIKSHGGTDALGFANALTVAVNLVRRDFNKVIKEDLSRVMQSDPAELRSVVN